MVDSTDMGMLDRELGWSRRVAEARYVIDAPLIVKRNRQWDMMEAIGLGILCILTGILVGIAGVAIYNVYF